MRATMKGKGKGHPWQTQQGSRGAGISLVILNLGTRWRWMSNATPRPLYPWKRTSVQANLCRSIHVHILQRAGRTSSASGSVWNKSATPTGVPTVHCKGPLILQAAGLGTRYGRGCIDSFHKLKIPKSWA